MTKGDKRRNRRKYRVRYDRIVIFTLILAILVVLITSCSIALFGKHEPKPDKPRKPQSSNSQAEQDTTEAVDVQAPTEPVSETPLSGFSLLSLDKSHIYKGDLVLVNAKNEYKFPEDDIDPVPVYANQNEYYSYGDMVTSYDKRALEQLNSMIEAFATENGLSATDIFVQDGYRTFAEQELKHKQGTSKTFEAGHSDYHTGRTIDLFRIDPTSGSGFSKFDATGDYAWFAENSGRFGFIVRYPEGKQEQTGENPRTYTYRYVGAPHAQYMNTHGLCLDEYIELLKSYNNESPLNVSVNGRSYDIYYAASTGEKTDVPIPTDHSFAVSGNNSDGFIITVLVS